MERKRDGGEFDNKLFMYRTDCGTAAVLVREVEKHREQMIVKYNLICQGKFILMLLLRLGDIAPFHFEHGFTHFQNGFPLFFI